ncbi:lysophospholipid acyltransferase family protein [Weissella viridescens]|uniref:1-acyl-sn-glycerol-3-phosphate acyltransferase n=3 Tax=Weissella viridescens TaxID=1629 RepID=A0A0R2H2D0_WEIVI|nr:1-acyl-sn-glycerol-3-phosphate acyltransferase [Weissella viridescens]KRN47091.1 1-acyl-sn-glycerol-3-phosphate acyltransferase [Weissella viridescens]MBX4172185.1 1-acyl-sn-glycerol-3-phosphate acyltransferase [Weissella viridescens]MCB6839808.1 1-acyl-sn-glycerol-3-phosphate acyltransferase [Weissella viridescens]MCB6846540.1 1-acyl-sn-glycerol-3-phosphate acyltransferase [Weissella viridescens]QOD85632.1 1-acyl-sn-glycerol-3-phosphate acyltransferase [Weissella viridescens]
MFYTVGRYVVTFVLWVFNGRYRVVGKENLPTTGNYIIVGPHRALWDMIYFAMMAWPKHFAFMAKKELFKNPILRWILVHANAFSVDRENPGLSAIKTPVNILKKTDLSLIMFPSGSRHSQKLKGGSVVIAKTSGKPLVPVVYQGPLTLGELFNPFKRGGVAIGVGEPISIDKKMKLNDDTTAAIDKQLTDAFKTLDTQLDPNFVYVDPKAK